MNTIKHKLIALISIAILLFNMAPAISFAQTSQIKQGANSAAGESGGQPVNTLNNLTARIIDIISLVIGLIAVVMIIFAGFRYITSGGDSNKVSSAKSTLIYAIIGLFIVGVAQVIAQIVIKEATQVK